MTEPEPICPECHGDGKIAKMGPGGFEDFSYLPCHVCRKPTEGPNVVTHGAEFSFKLGTASGAKTMIRIDARTGEVVLGELDPADLLMVGSVQWIERTQKEGMPALPAIVVALCSELARLKRLRAVDQGRLASMESRLAEIERRMG